MIPYSKQEQDKGGKETAALHPDSPVGKGVTCAARVSVRTLCVQRAPPESDWEHLAIASVKLRSICLPLGSATFMALSSKYTGCFLCGLISIAEYNCAKQKSLSYI